jgi:hypothetical protein
MKFTEHSMLKFSIKKSYAIDEAINASYVEWN